MDTPDVLPGGRAALLTVDFQNDFCHPDGAMAGAGNDVRAAMAAAERMHWLLSAIRDLRIPVVHARTEHSRWTDSWSWARRPHAGREAVCRAGTWGAELYRLAPAAEEYVLAKHRYSAFIGTDLDMILRSLEVSVLLVGGVATHVCVESTVRDGFMLGYWTVTLGDCSAAYRPEDHERSLDVLARYFGAVADAAGILAELRR